jgi:hypothetical protein
MIAGGIAAAAHLNDDQTMPAESLLFTTQDRGEIAFELCDAASLAARAEAALADLRERLDAFAQSSEPLRRLDPGQVEQLAAAAEEAAELASRAALVLDGVPPEGFAATVGEVADAAQAAFAEGIADERRAMTAAGLLSAADGFRALATALLASDAPTYWSTRVVDVLAAFRGVDPLRARQVAALAGVPETARFRELRPERVVELAHVLRQLAAR